MNELVVDIENSVTTVIEDDGRKLTDNSPFNPNNKLVSVSFSKITNNELGSIKTLVFYHDELDKSYTVIEKHLELQDALDWADVFVAHHAKYDYMWLLEAGFRMPQIVRCTMIGEYILARSVQLEKSLEATAIRRNVSRKKSDLTKEYWENGIGFESMPLPIVIEYQEADVQACGEIYLQQCDDYLKEKNRTLGNVLTLMNEMLLFIVEIERNGIKIDEVELERVKIDYENERIQIRRDLERIASDVMGDTPINLDSGADTSMLVYSRVVRDKALHKETFNIGMDQYGNPQYPPFMTDKDFATAVRNTTVKAYKTRAHQCSICFGRGKIRKTKKDGDPFKKENICSKCLGKGFLYDPLPIVAGLKLSPEKATDASIHGFKTGSDELDRLILQAKGKDNQQAVEFLEKKKRLNVINTYLNSFVTGIKRWVRLDCILHPGFNQCATATARLSSSDPNFQNQPKNKKFPIRKCIISRFDNGQIVECDFAGLEFVIAGELSQDPQIIDDIRNGKDIHKQTASIVYQKPVSEITKAERDPVKPHTFAPLYGAVGNDQPPHIMKYYKEFFNIYKRHGEWQVEQMDHVLKHGFVRTPSGREYAFPGTKRINAKKSSNHTRIVNYPVQGFATGDVVPLACVRALRLFRKHNLKSVLILTVHDSIVVDCHPDELVIVANILKIATTECPDEILNRWGYKMTLPLKSETSVGVNWGSLETYHG